jgi:hypothetical protein
MRKLTLFVLPLLFVFAACYQNGGDVAFNSAAPDKVPPIRNASNVVKVVLYIDASAMSAAEVEAALKEVGRYYIEPDMVTWKFNKNKSNLPYFDYVVIGGGQMKSGTASAYITVTDGLKNLMKNKYDTLIAPLKDKGIRILLGVSGGNDGIALGCLVAEDKLKNRETAAQMNFARQVYDACRFYNFDGVEFWDKDGEGKGVNPYPKAGEKFFNGEKFIPVEDEDEAVNYWKKGGGNLVDMVSCLVELFGATKTFQGDISKTENPVIVREAGYGRWLPPNVPRYDFADTMQTLDYVVNNSSDSFGFYGDDFPFPKLDGAPNDDMTFVGRRCYAPVIIDLAAVTPAKLTEYSQKLGRGEDVKKNIYYAVLGSSEYGLVYYENLGVNDTLQLGKLNETALEVFGSRVVYR